jgi:hypothetical protein
MKFHVVRSPLRWSVLTAYLLCCVAGGQFDVQIAKAQIKGNGEGISQAVSASDPSIKFELTSCKKFVVTGVEKSIQRRQGCVRLARK